MSREVPPKRKRLELFIYYTEQSGLDDALDEAARRIKEGNITGFDSNDESTFTFVIESA